MENVPGEQVIPVPFGARKPEFPARMIYFQETAFLIEYCDCYRGMFEDPPEFNLALQACLFCCPDSADIPY